MEQPGTLIAFRSEYVGPVLLGKEWGSLAHPDPAIVRRGQIAMVVASEQTGWTARGPILDVWLVMGGSLVKFKNVWRKEDWFWVLSGPPGDEP